MTALPNLNSPEYATGYILAPTASTYTTTIAPANNNLTITATGAITTWNVELPPAPWPGQIITISWPGGDIGTLNVTAQDDASIGAGVPSSGTGGSGGSTVLQYESDTNTWLVIGGGTGGGGGGGLPTGPEPIDGFIADLVRNTDPSGDSVLTLLPADGTANRSILELTSYAGSTSRLWLAGAQGVVGAPAASLSGDELAEVDYFGFDGSAWNISASVSVTAVENFDGTHHAVSYSVSTIGTDSDSEITQVPRFGVDSGGAFIVGTPGGPAASPGDVNIEGAFKVNGVAFSGGLPTGTAPISGIVSDVISNTDGGGQSGLLLIPPNASGGMVRIELDGIGGDARFIASAAGGVVGAPSQIFNGATLFEADYSGYGQTQYLQGADDSIFAAEDFDDTHSAVTRQWGTQSLDETYSVRLAIAGDGLVNFGTPSGLKPAQGSGTATATAGAATLNKQNGRVTSEALVAATTYTLTLTNSVILATSTVLPVITSSAALLVTLNSVTVSAGQVIIVVSMAALTGTLKFDFAVFN